MKKGQEVALLKEFYADKKVFITGVHGFKGSWLALLLHELGAEVYGVGLQANDGLLFPLLRMKDLGIKTSLIDVRNREIIEIVKLFNPDVVFHLAAQPIVSVGYDDPYLTFTTNTIGTVNMMDAVRALPGKCSFVCVTTDKCYKNVEKNEPYKEDEVLMGDDPYSSSKSAAELVAFCYRESYFKHTSGTSEKIMSTCRAGNVIGGGDFALNRIIPDMVRSLETGDPVTIRNFESVRPYEHILDALYAYVLLGAKQWDRPEISGAYNIGPDTESIMKTRELSEFFKKNAGLQVIDGSGGKTFHEHTLLSLDSTKFRETFNWAPTWATKTSMLEKTLDWYQDWLAGEDVTDVTFRQIREFLND